MQNLEDLIDDFLSDVSYLSRIADDTDYDNFYKDIGTFQDTVDDIQAELDFIRKLLRSQRR